VTSFGNLYRKYDEVPRAICRGDGTVPKYRRKPGRLSVNRDASLIEGKNVWPMAYSCGIDTGHSLT
jgi:hypothetical protein